MNNYELTLILNPDLSTKFDDFQAKFEKTLTDINFKINKLENIGRRQLAYSILNHNKGHYAILQIEGPDDYFLLGDRGKTATCVPHPLRGFQNACADIQVFGFAGHHFSDLHHAGPLLRRAICSRSRWVYAGPRHPAQNPLPILLLTGAGSESFK